MGNFLTSSIGKKIIMSLAGLFLVSFLLVHLGINLLLIFYESTGPFNRAAHFMSSNLLIKVFEIVLGLGFLLHILYGIIVQIGNWLSRPTGYKVENYSQQSFFSKFMFHTAAIIFAFLVIHLMDFYFKAKFGPGLAEAHYYWGSVEDMGSLVLAKFKIPEFVVLYIASFLFLGFHLWHGFQSAFQTLGLNHKTYTPLIKAAGMIYTVVVVAGFTLIPLVIYFTRK